MIFHRALAALAILATLAAGAAAGTGAPAGGAADAVGSGDGLTHVIPTLSALSVRNGERLTIQAVVTAQGGVARIEARIERADAPPGAPPLETLELRPAPAAFGGTSAAGTVGLWQADWTAAGLEKAAYRVAVAVTDASGHAFTDASLRFSDPTAGRTTVGSAEYPEGGMRRIDSADDLLGEDNLWSAVVDVAAGYGYFGTGTVPGRVVKVALHGGSSPPTRIGTLRLNAGESVLSSAVIDVESGYAYFGTDSTPGIVVKVALGDGSNLPTRVGAVTLDAGEDRLQSAVIDAAGEYAYFGTSTSPGRVV